MFISVLLSHDHKLESSSCYENSKANDKLNVRDLIHNVVYDVKEQYVPFKVDEDIEVLNYNEIITWKWCACSYSYGFKAYLKIFSSQRNRFLVDETQQAIAKIAYLVTYHACG